MTDLTQPTHRVMVPLIDKTTYSDPSHTATRPNNKTSYLPQPTEQEVERNFAATQRLSNLVKRLAIARDNASKARSVAIRFGEHAMRFSTLTQLGDDVDRAVAANLAAHCKGKEQDYMDSYHDYEAQAKRLERE